MNIQLKLFVLVIFITIGHRVIYNRYVVKISNIMIVYYLVPI